jgi:hypothetical protein
MHWAISGQWQMPNIKWKIENEICRKTFASLS